MPTSCTEYNHTHNVCNADLPLMNMRVWLFLVRLFITGLCLPGDSIPQIRDYMASKGICRYSSCSCSAISSVARSWTFSFKYSATGSTGGMLLPSFSYWGLAFQRAWESIIEGSHLGWFTTLPRSVTVTHRWHQIPKLFAHVNKNLVSEQWGYVTC